jgi:Transposase DDE domain
VWLLGRVGCVNSIACAKTADLQAEPTLRTPHAVSSRRKAIVEPVFGQIDTVQDSRRLRLRGKQAARDQWRFQCAIHNLLKLHRAGGLDLIRAPNSAAASPPASNRRASAMIAYAIAARFRRSLADRFAWTVPIPVTDARS